MVIVDGAARAAVMNKKVVETALGATKAAASGIRDSGLLVSGVGQN